MRAGSVPSVPKPFCASKKSFATFAAAEYPAPEAGSDEVDPAAAPKPFSRSAPSKGVPIRLERSQAG